MFEYHLSNKAVEDLSNIWNHTYETWSENQADKYYFELLSDCQELAENQNMGRNYDDIDEYFRIFIWSTYNILRYFERK